MLWFVKARRAQSLNDYETWNEGGVVPTLNLGDNTGDTRATVLIFYGNRVDDIRIQGDVINTLQARMGTGGGNMPMIFENRHDEGIRISEGGVVPTIRSAYGTGGGNVPMIFDNSDESKVYEPKSAFEENWAESEVKNALRANASKSSHAVVSATVRRLTPMECERLQGFPDSWTKWTDEGKEQADSHRYKQMGNAVAVPVVSWIVNRLMGAANDLG